MPQKSGVIVAIGLLVLILSSCASSPPPTDRSGFTAMEHYNFGLSYLDDNDLERAEQSFLKAIELNNKFGDAYIQLGMVYYILYEKVASSNNDEMITKNYNLAYNCLQNGLKYSTRNPRGYTLSARLQIIRGQINNAITNLLKAKDFTGPDEIEVDALISYELGNCYLAIGRLPEALEEYKGYLNLVPAGAQHDDIKQIVKEIEKQLDSQRKNNR
ncbi:MAG: hypothetical protein QME51_00600 [Planctomycetota bacterium]|nr:hypothetical protein [Planctomycetota bacterium]